MKKNLYLLLSLFIGISASGLANGLQIGFSSATTNSITFDISWNNSWNLPGVSHDGAWVFIKYQDCGSAEKAWSHLNLSTTSAQHSSANPLLQVDAVTDGKGVFIRRSAQGGGDVPVTAITVGLATPFASVSQINFDVVGIEVVYVPQGSFVAGDGVSTRTFGTSGTLTPYEILSEAEIPTNGLANSTDQNAYNGNTHPTVPAAFPKGYNGFYCMKYEITQNQYVHFLNTLTANQQANRTAQAPGSPAKTYAMHNLAYPNVRRNYIQIKTPASGNPLTPAVYGVNRDNDNNFDETEDGGGIACGFLSWYDLLAYLDWAGLRPMTELEFEKACRGPLSAGPFTAGIYAWGSTSIVQAHNQNESPGNILDPGSPSERSTAVGNGIAAYGRDANDVGPFRSGFAATVGSGRQQSGATYYGIMEMSGNVAEQVVSIGRQNNSNIQPAILPAIFTGVPGDGELTGDGEANQPGWGSPLDFRESIVRGGSFANNAPQLRISDRNYLFYTTVGNENRGSWFGGRGVRQY